MAMSTGPFKVVQPWGRNRGVEATTVSSHGSVGDAYARIEYLQARLKATGVPDDAIELLVVDAAGQLMDRSH